MFVLGAETRAFRKNCVKNAKASKDSGFRPSKLAPWVVPNTKAATTSGFRPSKQHPQGAPMLKAGTVAAD